MNKISNFFDIARKLALSKNDRRSYLLACVGERNDGVIVGSSNSPSPVQERKAHCEYRVCAKIDARATLYVVRIRLLDSSFAISRPCPSCQKIIRSKGVVRVYYTISNEQYGIWFPENNSDRYVYKSLL